jgi:hypothetical protein
MIVADVRWQIERDVRGSGLRWDLKARRSIAALLLTDRDRALWQLGRPALASVVAIAEEDQNEGEDGQNAGDGDANGQG